MVKYVEPVFRPPAEADSLIFQVAYGCPHNTCRFCGMYKGVKHSIRDINEVLDEFSSAAALYPETSRIFLADGDVMMLPFTSLHTMLLHLNRVFPRLSRVNLYANGSSILKKSEDELKELKRLKLNTLYLGLESGDQELLDKVCKGERADDMIQAVNIAQQCGLKASVMILLGLGGKQGTGRHAELTADVLNRMQPRLLSALRFVQVPGLKMYTDYVPVTEHEAVSELLEIIQRLKLNKTVFRANHSSNPVPLRGRFPHDRDRLATELKTILAGPELDREGPGRLPLFL